MNERRALIWFSCFCWASANLSSTPRLAASLLIESVLAVRQALSAPIWEKPTVSFSAATHGAATENRLPAAMRRVTSFFMHGEESG